jgi:hypothetical protein
VLILRIFFLKKGVNKQSDGGNTEGYGADQQYDLQESQFK